MNSVTREMFDAVRDALAGREMDEAQRRDLAQRVSEAGMAFRRRVDRAVRYTRDGLRLEAAAEAEADPSIFEVAQALDSPDLHKWRAACQRAHLPAPDAPDPAALGEIEEAIAQLRPLRKYMARMRTLVLSDAPPWDRLLVLRSLRAHDPHNHAWKEDQAALEPKAAEWLAERCEKAVQAGHLNTAARMLEHLEDGGWRSLDVSRPVGQLRTALHAAVVAECVRKAAPVVERLEAEWAAEDAPAVRATLAEWHELNARAVEHDGQMEDALLARVARVEEWLDERTQLAEAQRDHRDRAAALQRILDAQVAPLQEIRAALKASEDTSEGCPDDLRRRTLDRIDQLERKQRARRAAVAGAGLLVLAAAVTGVWLGVKYVTHNASVSNIAASIQNAVDAGRLEDAERILKEAQADPAVAGDERIGIAGAALARAQLARTQAVTNFAALMAEAGDPESAAAHPEAVEEAKELARTPEQQAAVEEWVRKRRRAEAQRAAERTRDLSQRIAELAKEVSAVDPSTAEAPSTLTALETKLQALERSAADQPELRQQLDNVRALVVAQRSSAQSAAAGSERQSALQALAAQSTEPLALAGAIKAFADRYPGTPEAVALAQAAVAAPQWNAVAQWNEVVGTRPWGRAAQLSNEERDTMRDALKAYVDAYPASPFAALARQMMAMLSNPESWRGWASGKLDTLPAFTYYVVDLIDGSRLYTTQDPARINLQSRANLPQYKVIPVLQKDDPAGGTVLMDVDTARIKKAGPSPQMLLAGQLRQVVADPEPQGDWANGMTAALAVLQRVRDAQDVDGAFAAQLARGVLESLDAEAPAELRPALQSAAKRIARERPEDVAWVAGSQPARARSAELRALLKQVLTVEAWRKTLAEAPAAVAGAMMRPVPVGMLMGLESRVLTTPPGTSAPAGASLLALKVGVGTVPSELVRIGQVDGAGAVTLDQAASAFPMGTMVFALPSKGAGQ
ncbi:MAG: hypothetical protein U0636_00470 [Phycisphaerales bacterium]